jgi:hypothetical protein
MLIVHLFWLLADLSGVGSFSCEMFVVYKKDKIIPIPIMRAEDE